MKIKKVVLIIFAVITLILVGGYMTLLSLTYNADESIDHIVEMATLKQNVFMFFNEEATANIVYYPGGLVKPEAYLEFAYNLSISGYNVFVPKMPFNLAILNISVIEKIIDNNHNNLPWFIGGHSLGGAAASLWVIENQEMVKGIFYLASYPANSSDLSASNLHAISIYGSLDGVLNYENLEKAKQLMPSQTIYYEIEGGNHAQFGHYSDQNGDLVATITREEQQNLIIEYLQQWIDSII